MRRRDFITLLGGAAAWPLSASAQQPRMPVVGYLYSGSEVSPLLLSAFRNGLGDTGYFEGQNVTVEYRWGNNVPDRLPELATDLVHRNVAVIATPGSYLAARAAKAATSTIPIVFSTGVDPVQAGLVASLNRPGANVTGVNYMQAELAGKQLGLLHELLPRATRIAALVDPNNAVVTNSAITELQRAASLIGVQVEILRASSNVEVIESFETISQKHIEALLVSPGPLFSSRAEFVALAAQRAIPTMYYDREFAEVGGLISYGSSLADQYRETGIYTGRVLKGEKPLDMPVLQATSFELVINLAAAKVLHVDVPAQLLARADAVIE